jgi:hypothetical protein
MIFYQVSDTRDDTVTALLPSPIEFPQFGRTLAGAVSHG